MAGPDRPSLLAICTAAPWPVRDGYTLRVFNLLQELTSGWAITLIAPPAPAAGGLDLADYMPVALTGTGLSYPWRFDQAPLHKALAQALRGRRYDRALIWPGAESLWFNRPDLPPAVADVIDCNTLEFWRGLWRDHGLRARLRNLRQLGVATRVGARTLRSFAATVCVGEADAAWLRRMGRGTVEVIPNGVDLPTMAVPEAPMPTLSFVGTLDFGPNIDAVLHAAGAIWPRVRASVPDASFVIAGRRPTADIRALHGQAGITVTGDVLDMAAVLGRSWLSVAPMRSGVGIKNKVLEAWASARPVVMTAMATNGLSLPPGHATLVQRGDAGMADRIVALLRDSATRHRLGAAAREHVARHFTWHAAAERVDELLRNAGEK